MNRSYWEEKEGKLSSSSTTDTVTTNTSPATTSDPTAPPHNNIQKMDEVRPRPPAHQLMLKRSKNWET